MSFSCPFLILINRAGTPAYIPYGSVEIFRTLPAPVANTLFVNIFPLLFMEIRAFLKIPVKKVCQKYSQK